MKEAYRQARPDRRFLAVLSLFFLCSAFYPSDMNYYSARVKDSSPLVRASERYARHINAATQGLAPLLFADKIGFAQAVYVALGTTAATYTLKSIFNNVTIASTKLGQRPYGRDSKHNVPSGHSAMASSAMFFIFKRYRKRRFWYLLPLTGLTMYARIMLKAHTLSGVLAGCALGIIIAELFTSKLTETAGDAAAPASDQAQAARDVTKTAEPSST